MDNKGRIIEGSFATPELEYLAPCDWEFTEKVDGTNVRVIWDGEKVEFHGRTDNAQMPVFLYRRLEEMFRTPEMTAKLSAQFAGAAILYGEGFGAKIQKGGGNYKPDGVDFVLFDVLVGSWWLKSEDVTDVGFKLDIQQVPIIGRGSLGYACAMVQHGIRSQWGDFAAEGLVLRPLVPLFSRKGERIITKIKTRDYQS